MKHGDLIWGILTRFSMRSPKKPINVPSCSSRVRTGWNKNRRFRCLYKEIPDRKLYDLETGIEESRLKLGLKTFYHPVRRSGVHPSLSRRGAYGTWKGRLKPGLETLVHRSLTRSGAFGMRKGRLKPGLRTLDHPSLSRRGDFGIRKGRLKLGLKTYFRPVLWPAFLGQEGSWRSR